MLSQNDIRLLVHRIDAKQDEVDDQKIDLKALLDSVKDHQMRPDALKSAMKLRKLKPTTLKAWLDTFDAVRDALGLDDQLDLEDAIKQAATAKEKADKAAAKLEKAVERTAPPSTSTH